MGGEIPGPSIAQGYEQPCRPPGRHVDETVLALEMRLQHHRSTFLPETTPARPGMITSALAAVRRASPVVASRLWHAASPAAARRLVPAAAHQLYPGSAGTPRTTATTTPPDSTDNRKVMIFANYTVYKTKGACTVQVIKPTWGKTSTGQGLTVTRDGTLLLEFANAKGEKEYDWDAKEVRGAPGRRILPSAWHASRHGRCLTNRLETPLGMSWCDLGGELAGPSTHPRSASPSFALSDSRSH